jgi:cytochrome c biogenesis protein CcmG/thiol:disulfide interchange protein DsbE
VTSVPKLSFVTARALLLVGLLVPPACAHADSGPPPPSAASPVLGARVPAFKRASVQGPIFDSAAASGRVLVVDFFAAYCPPCQRALPSVERLAQQRRDVVFVGVSLDEDADLALRQVRRHRITFPVVHDAGNALAGRFRVTDLPATFVVDGAGRVAWASGPGQPDGSLDRAVAAVAAGL